MWTLSLILFKQPLLTALCCLPVFHSLTNISVSSVSQTQWWERWGWAGGSSEYCGRTINQAIWRYCDDSCAVQAPARELLTRWTERVWEQGLLRKRPATGTVALPKGQGHRAGLYALCVQDLPSLTLRVLPAPTAQLLPTTTHPGRGQMRTKAQQFQECRPSLEPSTDIWEYCKNQKTVTLSPLLQVTLWPCNLVFVAFLMVLFSIYFSLLIHSWRIIHVHTHKTGKNILS